MTMTDTRPRSRWLRRSMVALIAAGALAVGTIAAAPAAMGGDDLDLGPTLVETNTAPSGYAMKFRYQAPAGVNQVHIYGDWTYSVPENVTCDGCGDGRLPYDWQPGDVAATQWRTMPMVLGQGGSGRFRAVSKRPSAVSCAFRASKRSARSPRPAGCTPST